MNPTQINKYVIMTTQASCLLASPLRAAILLYGEQGLRGQFTGTWCGQPSDRGRLKNRIEIIGALAFSGTRTHTSCSLLSHNCNQPSASIPTFSQICHCNYKFNNIIQHQVNYVTGWFCENLLYLTEFSCFWHCIQQSLSLECFLDPSEAAALSPVLSTASYQTDVLWFLPECSTTGTMMGNVISLPLAGLLCQYGFSEGWDSVFYVIGENSNTMLQK